MSFLDIVYLDDLPTLADAPSLAESDVSMAAKAHRSAAVAADTVRAYCNVLGSGPDGDGEPLDSLVTDLLTDLWHLADAAGLDFSSLIDRADFSHTAETL